MSTPKPFDAYAENETVYLSQYGDGGPFVVLTPTDARLLAQQLNELADYEAGADDCDVTRASWIAPDDGLPAWRAECTCCWVSPPYSTRGFALDAAAAHVKRTPNHLFAKEN